MWLPAQCSPACRAAAPSSLPGCWVILTPLPWLGSLQTSRDAGECPLHPQQEGSCAPNVSGSWDPSLQCSLCPGRSPSPCWQQSPYFFLVVERGCPIPLLQVPADLAGCAAAKLSQLLPEAGVGVGNGPDGPDGLQHLLAAQLRHGHHVGDDHGGAAGDASEAVDEAVPSMQATLVDETDAFLEVPLDVGLRGVRQGDAEVGDVLQQGLGRFMD